MSSDYYESGKGNILIVDDAPENVRLLSAMFSQAGYGVKSVGEDIPDLQAALESIRVNTFDVLLLDTDIPEIDGYEVCRKIKSDLETNAIAVIFLSFSNNLADKLRGFELGGADYITKPFQISEVFARVKNQIEQVGIRKQIEAQNKLLQEEIILHIATQEALQEANHRLECLNQVDGLTMLSNRRYFNEYLEGTWRQMQREMTSLSLIICNIDLFNLYNETYGRDQGDNCLQKVAQATSKAVKRPGDLAARYGEEDFSIILPNTDASGAIAVAKHIQRELQRMALPHSQNPQGYLTVSIGVSMVEPNQLLEPQILLDTTEQALYQAKQEGRDRIIFKMVDPPESPLP